MNIWVNINKKKTDVVSIANFGKSSFSKLYVLQVLMNL